MNNTTIPISSNGELVRSPSMIQKMIDFPKLMFNTNCCINVDADDCMNNNKTKMGGALLIVGILIGALLTYLIMYYINESKHSDQ